MWRDGEVEYAPEACADFAEGFHNLPAEPALWRVGGACGAGFRRYVVRQPVRSAGRCPSNPTILRAPFMKSMSGAAVASAAQRALMS